MNALYINPVKLPPVNAGRLRERKITHSNYMVNTRGDVFATGKRQVNKKDRHVTVNVVLSGTNAFSKESKIIISRCPVVNIRRC